MTLDQLLMHTPGPYPSALELTYPANHDLTGMVGMLLVANVIDHTDLREVPPRTQRCRASV